MTQLTSNHWRRWNKLAKFCIFVGSWTADIKNSGMTQGPKTIHEPSRISDILAGGTKHHKIYFHLRKPDAKTAIVFSFFTVIFWELTLKGMDIHGYFTSTLHPPECKQNAVFCGWMAKWIQRRVHLRRGWNESQIGCVSKCLTDWSELFYGSLLAVDCPLLVMSGLFRDMPGFCFVKCFKQALEKSE